MVSQVLKFKKIFYKMVDKFSDCQQSGKNNKEFPEALHPDFPNVKF